MDLVSGKQTVALTQDNELLKSLNHFLNKREGNDEERGQIP